MQSADFRKHAAEAFQKAEAALTEDNRSAWMKIAEGYRALADQADALATTRLSGNVRPRDPR